MAGFGGWLILFSGGTIALVAELMVARNSARSAKPSEDLSAEVAAHHAVDVAKRKLCERGPCGGLTGRPI